MCTCGTGGKLQETNYVKQHENSQGATLTEREAGETGKSNSAAWVIFHMIKGVISLIPKIK